MKQPTNLEMTKIRIVEYIRAERKCVFKTSLMRDLLRCEFKKTNISNGLRELRKEKIVCLYRKRWGLR
jgi:hypothetical protein